VSLFSLTVAVAYRTGESEDQGRPNILESANLESQQCEGEQINVFVLQMRHNSNSVFLLFYNSLSKTQVLYTQRVTFLYQKIVGTKQTPTGINFVSSTSSHPLRNLIF
jgi:hypothetical protein